MNYFVKPLGSLIRLEDFVKIVPYKMEKIKVLKHVYKNMVQHTHYKLNQLEIKVKKRV